jgi:hypothetical protein
MKKLLTGLLAVGLVLALTLPASAFDSEFGGYWRTRAYMQKDFTGSDTGKSDLQQVDTRTRLYYTAVFSEDFKFVNKFEWNVTWGDTVGGDIGTDGMGIFRIKNSYANFNLGSVNFLIGLQPRTLHRGFLFDDDFAGAVVTFNGSGFSIPLIWMKAYEGGTGNTANDNDVDYYVLKPTFTFGNTALTPTLAYVYSKDASKWPTLSGNKEVKVYFAGLDADLKFGGGSTAWFTGIYEGGSAELINGKSMDISAYLLALGGKVNVGAIDIHGQVFYATGEDKTTTDSEAFYVPKGQSYYWAELMGYGIFDNQFSAGSPADQISNILAANIGVGFKVSDALKITVDLWHAKLAESDAKGNDVLGTEIDLVLTYSLMKNLTLDVVGAYLFAGDATYGGSNSANPYEIGTRLSFSF